MPIQIRKGEPRDAATIAEFNRAMAWETEHKELSLAIVQRGVERVFTDPKKGFYLVATNAEQIVGQLMVTYEWSDWRDGWFWWVQSVYVPPTARQQGIFRSLFTELLTLAHRAGDVVGVRLYVEKENAKAQQTYASLGMHEAGYLLYELEFPQR